MSKQKETDLNFNCTLVMMTRRRIKSEGVGSAMLWLPAVVLTSHRKKILKGETGVMKTSIYLLFSVNLLSSFSISHSVLLLSS